MCDHSFSTYGHSHSEGTTHGETEGSSWCYSTGMSRSASISIGSPTEPISFWASSSRVSAQASPRVSAAAVPLERQLRGLARHLTVAEFHALRTRLEDCCDDILLNSI
jgi:hypothetical protein